MGREADILNCRAISHAMCRCGGSDMGFSLDRLILLSALMVCMAFKCLIDRRWYFLLLEFMLIWLLARLNMSLFEGKKKDFLREYWQSIFWGAEMECFWREMRTPLILGPPSTHGGSPWCWSQAFIRSGSSGLGCRGQADFPLHSARLHEVLGHIGES